MAPQSHKNIDTMTTVQARARKLNLEVQCALQAKIAELVKTELEIHEQKELYIAKLRSCTTAKRPSIPYLEGLLKEEAPARHKAYIEKYK